MSPTESSRGLPVISDDVVERIETAIFRRIREERRRGVERGRSRRRRVWLGAGAAAAVVVVAAVISPAVGGLVGGAGGSAEQDAVAPAIELYDQSLVEGGGAGERDGVVTAESAELSTEQGGTREIVASASASVLVDDIPSSAEEVTALAEQYGGYVQSLNIGADRGVVLEGADPGVIAPERPRAGYGWVTVRVPSEVLQAVIADLEDVGEVSGVSITRSDVTDQAIDLRARVDATRASVVRLTELLEGSGSLADLIAAEVALSDRQALLEGYEQQLEQLESQVALSSLQVDLSVASARVEADPAGFGDGLLAGWNGLVATLNGIVIALGFLLPWLVVIGIAGAIVWAILRLARRRRRVARPSSVDSE